MSNSKGYARDAQPIGYPYAHHTFNIFYPHVPYIAPLRNVLRTFLPRVPTQSLLSKLIGSVLLIRWSRAVSVSVFVTPGIS